MIMANFVSIIPRLVESKDPDKSYKIDEKALINQMFDDDFNKLSLLDDLQTFNISDKPTLFYPGSGCDIVFPCLYVEKLFNVKEIDFIFMDVYDNLVSIRTVLDDLGISIDSNNSFYWNGILIHLKFQVADVFVSELPSFDIYFEKAFRIMKDPFPNYEEKIVEKLNPNGVLISDSGFKNVKLQKIDVSKELSSYKEMVVGKKNK